VEYGKDSVVQVRNISMNKSFKWLFPSFSTEAPEAMLL
jgi:hypothetical protein